MVLPPPTLLRITAHHTPHASDPPDAHEFYAMLGMFTVAWGRFEGHFTGSMIQILNLPGASHLDQAVPISWKRRAKLWRSAFNSATELAPYQSYGIDFIKRLMDSIEDRHFGAHAIWDEFIIQSAQPTIKARTIKPRKGAMHTIDVRDYLIPLSLVKKGLDEVNEFNRELSIFTGFLNSLRQPPQGIQIL